MDKIQIEIVCVKCGQKHIISIFEQDYLKWVNGAMIQNAFPYMDKGVREMFISQICSDCFDLIFTNQK